MSRYIKRINNLEYAWGFDRPLIEYFFSCEDMNAPEDAPDNGFIFSVGSYTTLVLHPNFPKRKSWSNGDLLELMDAEEYKDVVPEKHKNAIAMDLPF